jgi:glycosyltransferase involved in cell wall biosynthesis
VFAGSLMRYKRPDLAVEACNRLGVPLVVAGVGPEFELLRKLAGPTVSFTGWISDVEMGHLLVDARALLHPGEEDFGILPVEAMAAGCPVIAFGGGGALDTIVDGVTGVLFPEQSVEALVAALVRFESSPRTLDPQRLRAHAHSFDTAVFSRRFSTAVQDLLTTPRALAGQTRA